MYPGSPQNDDTSSVLLQQYFDATPDDIFNAWIDPQIVRLWFFKSDKNEILDVKTDPRPGGAFSILEQGDGGGLIEHFGTYLAIQPPDGLQFTLEVPKHFPGVTQVTITIEAREDGAELIFLQTGVSPEIVKNSWQKMFLRLSRILES